MRSNCHGYIDQSVAVFSYVCGSNRHHVAHTLNYYILSLRYSLNRTVTTNQYNWMDSLRSHSAHSMYVHVVQLSAEHNLNSHEPMIKRFAKEDEEFRLVLKHVDWLPRTVAVVACAFQYTPINPIFIGLVSQLVMGRKTASNNHCAVEILIFVTTCSPYCASCCSHACKNSRFFRSLAQIAQQQQLKYQNNSQRKIYLHPHMCVDLLQERVIIAILKNVIVLHGGLFVSLFTLPRSMILKWCI